MTLSGLEAGTSLGGLSKTSLREQALDQLRNAVTSGELAPGTRLIETELSAALGISRGTLREALRQLQQEGLVEAGERGRLTVRTLSDAEILDMFAVRAALEGLAAAIVAGLPGPARPGPAAAGSAGRPGGGPRIDQPHGRGRPAVPPGAVRTDRQHHPGPDLGGPRRLDPDVDHVRRHRQGGHQHVRAPAPADHRRHRHRRSGTSPGTRSTSTCARPRRTCSATARANRSSPEPARPRRRGMHVRPPSARKASTEQSVSRSLMTHRRGAGSGSDPRSAVLVADRRPVIGAPQPKETCC